MGRVDGDRRALVGGRWWEGVGERALVRGYQRQEIVNATASASELSMAEIPTTDSIMSTFSHSGCPTLLFASKNSARRALY